MNWPKAIFLCVICLALIGAGLWTGGSLALLIATVAILVLADKFVVR